MAYDQEWQRFKEYDELVNKIKKSEVDHIAALRDLCIVENKLATDICNVFEQNDELYQAGLENKKIVAMLDAARGKWKQRYREITWIPLLSI